MKNNLAKVASLIGDSSRSSMLIALMGGKALTATELSLEASITPQTATGHLSKLVKGELLVVQKQGRHKYFQLRNQQIAELLETLLNVSSGQEYSTVCTGPNDSRLRKARVCYDHLAGELAVDLFNSLLNKGFITQQNGVTAISEIGINFFITLDQNFNQLTKAKRPICKSCLDWSERKHHLSGGLGKWILDDVFNQKWGQKNLDSRAISFNKQGLQKFKKRYGLN